MKTNRRDGTLSAYGLACGYVERVNGATLVREHGIYHVRGWVMGTHGQPVRAWQCFERLVNARKALRKLAALSVAETPEGSAS